MTRKRLHPASVVVVVLRLLVAAGLAVDAYVHFVLAPVYDGIGDQITQGRLFQAEGTVAALVAVLVLVFGSRRWPYLLAFLVTAGGLAGVLVYRYVDVGAIGAWPNMYEPAWFPKKTASAIAEGIAALLCLAALALIHPRTAPRTRHTGGTR